MSDLYDCPHSKSIEKKQENGATNNNNNDGKSINHKKQSICNYTGWKTLIKLRSNITKSVDDCFPTKGEKFSLILMFFFS